MLNSSNLIIRHLEDTFLKNIRFSAEQTKPLLKLKSCTIPGFITTYNYPTLLYESKTIVFSSVTIPFYYATLHHLITLQPLCLGEI